MDGLQSAALTRRRLLRAAVGSFLLCAGPRFRLTSQQLFNSADAWYLAAIALVVQAASLFIRSGNGFSAMLDSLANLTEESIRLSQNVLLRVADVQAGLDSIPDHVRVVLIENDQYRIRHEADAIVSNLAYVDFRIRSDARALHATDVRRKLNQCVAWGGKLAGAQAVPYGVGPIGALCAPAVAAAVAKSHTMLGESGAVRAEMATKFLPWLEKIQDPSTPGSVTNLFHQEADRLTKLTADTKDRIPPRLRDRLGPSLDVIARLEAGGSIDAPIACVSYMQAAGHKKGPCIKNICDGYDSYGPIRVPSSFSAENGQPPMMIANSTMLTQLCRCARYEDETIFVEGQKQRLVLSATNDTTAENGPSLTIKTEWQASNSNEIPGEKCDPGAYGSPLDATGEISAILGSKSASDWFEEALKLKDDGMNPIVQSREILWSYFNIIQSTRDAEQRMRRVFAL